jgi:hypothetical protein
VWWGCPVYTLGEAARASGKGKSTIAKAIKSGRISATRDPDGSYQIDPAELHRVYPVTSTPHGSGGRSDTGADTSGAPGDLVTWRALAIEREETIRHLWQRLDASEAERREIQIKLTALLTHQQTGNGTNTPATRIQWWRRWFR